MSDLRLVDCPKDRQVIADRVGPHSVRCRVCHVLICTCAGCGGMTLVVSGILLQCSPCGFERMARPSDLDAPVAAPRVQQAPTTTTQGRAPTRPGDHFTALPMPRQRGAR